MKTSADTKLAFHSLLTLALALTIWSPVHARSAEPAEGKLMMKGELMESCQAMKEQKEKVMADMKAQDAQLTERLTKMNDAPENRKLDLMAAVVTQMVQQRAAMHARMEKMQEGMMNHMMQHMQIGKESMSQCPMMKDMKAMDDKSGDAHKEHQAEKK
jgi:hypothetical protein